MGKWVDLIVVSVLLAAGAASATNSPGRENPDHYYVRKEGGAFQYGHQRTPHAFEKAEASRPGNVVGSFGYQDSTGEVYRIEYTADHRGFLPTGNHLPVAVSVLPKSAFDGQVGAASPDGGYSFNYETDSSDREESADSNLNVRGRFSFRGTDGRQRTVQYRAGADTGFVAQGDHLPSSPDVPSGSVPVPQQGSPAAPSTYSGSPAQGSSSSSADGSYSFNYDTDSSAREESADSNLNVRGQYSFRGDDGRRRTVQYRAGSDTGFVAQGDHLPTAPEVPSGSLPVPQTRSGFSAPSSSVHPSSPAQVKSSSSPDGSYSFNYESDSSAREESADSNLNVRGQYSFRGNDGRQRTVRYRAGSDTGFVAQGDHLPTAPEGPSGSVPVPQTRSGPSASSPSAHPSSPAQVRSSPDGGYSFNYETDSSDREESADANLNVRGRFSFRGTDGRQRTVQYRAGADTGFVAQGDHLPSSPDVPSGSVPVPQQGSPAAPSTYSGSPAQGSRSSSADGSYSFNYDTDSSAREESADSNLNVRGQYSFRGDDGRRRTVQYRAGSDTGFVAQGDHLPTAPEVPSGSVPVPQTRSSPSVSAPSPYSGPSSSPAQVKSSSQPDGSYNFNYETDSSAREESADSNLNVRGRYSFRGDDGRERTVQYRAGADSGFIAQGDHLPTAPEVPAPSAPVPQTRSSPSAPSPSAQPSSPAQVRSSSSPDGSYSFNYETDSSEREESADTNLNVRGRYSFRGVDGQQRTVQYKAGAKTGFVAQGDHLPTAPEVPAATVPIPQTRSSSSAPSNSPFPSAPAEVSSSPDGSYSFNYESDSSAREESADSNLNVRGQYSFRGDDGRQRTVQYRAGSDTGFVAQGDHLPTAPEVPSGSVPVPQTRSSPSASPPSPYPSSPAQVKSSSSPDGSYSFNYETDSSAREESADSNLNVRGQYSFRGNDGRQRTVRYRAGSDTGFVAQGDHFPTAPEVPSGSVPVPQTRSSPSASSPSAHPSSPAHVRSSPDGGYSFNYETDTSAREESADSNLNVRGRYSFRSDDGRQRTVQYRAGANTGFVAEGDHLPASPEVPSGSVPLPQTRSSPSAPSTFGSPSSPTHAASSSSPDGSYNFNYETDSSARKESADSSLNVRGQYSFRGDDGRQRTVQYKAGAGTGFVAQGDHLPTSPEVPAGAVHSSYSSQPSSVAGLRSSASSDGSYSFSYDADSSAREESADSNLNIRGRYSFRGNDGQQRIVQYRAGSGTGFVAEGDHLPAVGAAVPSSGALGFLSSDGSYRFEYETDSSARQENADPSLNVRGSYSFQADDGVRRVVSYRAGADTGFVAQGDHLPVAH